MIRHNKSKYSLLPKVWQKNQTGSKNVSSSNEFWIKMQNMPRLFIFQLKKKSSSKGTEGMPDEGINKPWQAEKLF